MRLLLRYLLIVWVVFCSPAFAVDDISTPDTYKVTMQKVELCTSSACTTSTTLAESSATFDIASKDAGAAVGTWIKNFALDVGTTYTHLKTTISSTFTISGSTTNSNIASGFCVTRSSPSTSSDHAVAAITAGSASASPSEMSWTVPNMLDANNGSFYSDLSSDYSTNGITKADGSASFTWVGALAQSYTPTPSSSPLITISFDVSNQFRSNQQGADACFVYVLPPSVSVSLTD